jgi:sugar lactone lactonase YvrE
MNKIYFLFFLIVVLFGVNIVYAQVPVLSYPTPQTFAVKQLISPIAVKNTGGEVPLGYYGQGSGVAGSGFYGFKDSPISYEASFANPVSVAVDTYGYTYVADANNNAIRKIDPDGGVTTLAGGGGAGSADGTGAAAKFNYPTGVATDKDANVYVTDFGNNSIRKITPAGVVTTITKTGLNLPYGLAVDANYNIIVADTYNHRIKKVTQSGVVTVIAGNGFTGLVDGAGVAASFNLPYAVTLDNAGNIYVADRNHNAIRKITTTGIVSTVVKNTNLSKPTGITIDSLGVLYVTNEIGFISKVTTTGISTVFAGADSLHNDGVTYEEGVDTAARYGANCGIGYDVSGNLIVADGQNFQVRRISLNGFKISPKLPKGLVFGDDATISGTPDSLSTAKDYTVTGYASTLIGSTTINITVSSIAGQTITFNPISSTLYGTADLKNIATSNNPNTPITYTSSNLSVATIVNNAVHIVGVGTSNITANQAGNATYLAAAPVTQVLTVTKGVLTITANNQNKIAGTGNPVLTFKYSGFAAGEDSTKLITKPVAQTTALPTSPAGVYPITVSGGVANNYTFTYVPATLTVAPLPVIIESGPTAFLTGDSVTLAIDYPPGYTYQWVYNGTFIPGATSSSYVAKITGNYAVNITINGTIQSSAIIPVTAAFILPPQNFKLQINAVTCKGSNNGTVFITATKKLNYTAIITDAAGASNSLAFTDTVTIKKLKPGSYNLCITISGQIYSQCFSVNIVEPKDLSVFSVVNRTVNTVNLQLGGASLYNVNLNGTLYTTSQSQLTLPLVAGSNKISVTTDKLCQGLFEKEILINDYPPYPNPFTSALNLNIGSTVNQQIHVSILSLASGREVYVADYINKAGVLQLDLKDLGSGLYYLNLKLDNRNSSFKILKK